MHFAVLIAAWMSFGQLSFDLSYVAAALDRTLESIQNRTLQMNWSPLDKTIPLRPLTSFDPGERVYKHVFKNGDRYFEFNYPSGEVRVECFTRKHGFEVTKLKGAWSKFQLHPKDQEQKRIWNFLNLSYAGTFFLPHWTLTEFLQRPAIQAVWMPPDQARAVLWGKWSHHHDPARFLSPTIIQFSAIVCFSESRQRAFFQWSDVLTISSSIVGREVTSSNAQFESESFRCNHVELARTQFPNCRTEEEVRNCKSPVVVRSEIRHRSHVDVKDEQLTPAYYGIDDEIILKHVQQADTEARAKARLRPPTPPGPRSVNNYQQYDLLIAIGIPVILLGVLLIVIRKT